MKSIKFKLISLLFVAVYYLHKINQWFPGLLRLYLAIPLILASFAVCANAQTPSPSTATSQSSAITETAATLNRSLDRIEALNFQILTLKEALETQSKLVETQEQRDGARKAEIEALQRALAAEQGLKDLESKRADLAESRIRELEKALSSAKKKTKPAFIIGVALGVFLGAKSF